jgi:hypothetical protein
MKILRSRTLWLTLGGGVLAVLIPLGVGFAILNHEQASHAPPPASTGGLVVQMGRPDDAKPDPTTPLRCFVAGQFVGMSTLADCASKNGVATQALDVGVDSSGGLAAESQAGADLTPLPPSDDDVAVEPAANDATAQAASTPAAAGDCLRYGGGGWRKLSDHVSLSNCVQALYAGHCEPLGGASYGRWMGQTLRLVPHRVELSTDNKTFRALAQQSDTSCAINAF